MGEQRRRDRAQHGAQRTAEQVISCEAEVLSKRGLKTVRERKGPVWEKSLLQGEMFPFFLWRKNASITCLIKNGMGESELRRFNRACLRQARP